MAKKTGVINSKSMETPGIEVAVSDRDYRQWVVELNDRYRATQIKAAIVANIERTLLSLGRLVSFVGREYPVEIGVSRTKKKTVSAMLRAERTNAKRIARALNKSLIVLDTRQKHCAEKVVTGLAKALDARRTVACYKDPRLW